MALRLEAVRRAAWVVPFGYGALLVTAALGWVVRGAPFDEGTWGRVVGPPWPEEPEHLGEACSSVRASAS